MLKEARDDLNKQTRQHEEEVQLLNEQLQNKRDLDFIRFKEFVERGGNPALYHGAPTTAEVIINIFLKYFSYLFIISVSTYS
jgi:hypothetical protein